MTKRLTFKGSQINFSQDCLICGGPAEKEHTVSRTLSYGNRTITLNLPIPLCIRHFDIASRQNSTEKLVGRVGLILGAMAGIAVMMALLSYWNSTQQGNLFMNLLLAGFLGIGAFLILWVLLAFFVAPLFGDPDSKAVRNMMKIRHYWPASQDIQLEFADDVIAEKVASLNADHLLRKE